MTALTPFPAPQAIRANHRVRRAIGALLTAGILTGALVLGVDVARAAPAVSPVDPSVLGPLAAAMTSTAATAVGFDGHHHGNGGGR